MAVVLNGNGTLTGLTTGGISSTKAIADAAMPQGAMINQSVQMETATVSSSTAQGAYSGALISISYAAASSSNTLLVIAQYNISISGTTAAAYATLHVGGSPSSFRGDASGNRNRITTSARSGNAGGLENQSLVALITSPSTSSTTYDVRGSHANDSTHTIFLNRTGSDVDQNYEGRCASSITIMEFVG
tara:strand:+ start:757 stop:1323 length:567 start_codon:yes stop_codon:yes gene_type:complete